MRVLLDVNVILDVMLQRPPWHQEADAILVGGRAGASHLCHHPPVTGDGLLRGPEGRGDSGSPRRRSEVPGRSRYPADRPANTDRRRRFAG
jgi:hypothetical protein